MTRPVRTPRASRAYNPDNTGGWLDDSRTPRSSAASGDALLSHTCPHPQAVGGPCSFPNRPSSSTLPSKATHPHIYPPQVFLRISGLHLRGDRREARGPPTANRQTPVYLWSRQELCRSVGFCSKERPPPKENCWAVKNRQPQAPALQGFAPGGKERALGTRDVACEPSSGLWPWTLALGASMNQDSTCILLSDRGEQRE